MVLQHQVPVIAHFWGILLDQQHHISGQEGPNMSPSACWRTPEFHLACVLSTGPPLLSLAASLCGTKAAPPHGGRWWTINGASKITGGPLPTGDIQLWPELWQPLNSHFLHNNSLSNFLHLIFALLLHTEAISHFTLCIISLQLRCDLCCYHHLSFCWFLHYHPLSIVVWVVA